MSFFVSHAQTDDVVGVELSDAELALITGGIDDDDDPWEGYDPAIHGGIIITPGQEFPPSNPPPPPANPPTP